MTHVGFPDAEDELLLGDLGKLADLRIADQPASPQHTLSDEQTAILSLVLNEQKNVFFTGSAGSGKSHLLRNIIKALEEKYLDGSGSVAVTASTGVAAAQIGGSTLHSFAGMGISKLPVEQLVKKIRKNKLAKERWKSTSVLVIDEISMVDAEFFDTLDAVARRIRRKTRLPFGGLQLVVTGDFFQLPPVSKNDTARFCFEATAWSHMHHTINLSKVFRQKDPEFAELLNEMRQGRLSAESIRKLKELRRPLCNDQGLEPTQLFPMRWQVDAANELRMRKLSGISYKYKALDGGEVDNMETRSKLLSGCIAPETLTLKKGAQVMLTKNINELIGLVNGSVGEVIGFGEQHPDDSPPLPIVRFRLADGQTRHLTCGYEKWTIEELVPDEEEGGKLKATVLASRTQIPLILAWALSIHKAQGQTLQLVKVDVGRVFEKGQAYVALSRATTMAGLQIINFDHKKVVAHEKVQHFYRTLSTTPQQLSAAPAKPKRAFPWARKFSSSELSLIQ